MDTARGTLLSTATIRPSWVICLRLISGVRADTTSGSRTLSPVAVPDPGDSTRGTVGGTTSTDPAGKETVAQHRCGRLERPLIQIGSRSDRRTRAGRPGRSQREENAESADTPTGEIVGRAAFLSAWFKPG